MRPTYLLSSLFFCCYLSLLSCFATNIYGGNVSGLWTLSGSPYFVHGGCNVPSGSSLVIEPGVVIKFAQNARIWVYGSIRANGTATDSIRMEYGGTNAWYNHISPSPGWWGIRISNYGLPMDSSSFSYCDISGVRQSNAGMDTTNGVLNVGYSYLYFAHNRLHHNVTENANMGISLTYCTTEIAYNELYENNLPNGVISLDRTEAYLHHNHIHHNYNDLQSNGPGAKTLTPGIFAGNQSKVLLAYNDIHHNINAEGFGGGIASQGGIKLYHNKFYENEAKSGGGAAFLTNGYFPTSGVNDIIVDGNLFANNADLTDTYVCGITDGGGGVNISQDGCEACKTIITNNIFANNRTGSWGGALRLYKANTRVVNNDFVNNIAHINGGALQIFSSPGKQVFANNNIFFGNETEDQLFYPHVSVDCEGLYGTMIFEFNHTDYPYNQGFNVVTQDSMLSYNFNQVIASPNFIAPTTLPGLVQNGATANWGLLGTSPCINAGDLDTTGCYLSAFDYKEQTRIVANHIDVGAIEYRLAESLNPTADISALKVFPNPVQNWLHIPIAVPNNGNYHYQITDLSGRMLDERQLEGNTDLLTIPVEKLGQGFYLLLLEQGCNRSQTSFFKQ